MRLHGEGICDAEKMEAESAVEAYLFHWERHYAKIMDAECKKILEENEKVHSANNKMSLSKPDIQTSYQNNWLEMSIVSR